MQILRSTSNNSLISEVGRNLEKLRVNKQMVSYKHYWRMGYHRDNPVLLGR